MTSPTGAATEEPSIRYRAALDALIVAEDAALRGHFLADRDFLDAAVAYFRARPRDAGRRMLLSSSVQLTRSIAPEVFAAADHCTRVLGLQAEVEIFCQPDPGINAFVLLPEANHILIALSAPAIERLDEDELRFVIGHEIAHILFSHLDFDIQMVKGSIRISPLQALRLMAWKRWAELSADRVGLICAGHEDAVVRAFFKLSSGLTRPRFLIHAVETARQYSALLEEGKDPSLERLIAVDTHPFNPVRVHALHLFVGSKLHHRIAQLPNQSGVDDEQLAARLSGLGRFIEPEILRGEDTSDDAARAFCQLAVGLLTLHDHHLDEAEIACIRQMGLNLEAITPDNPLFTSPDGKKLAFAALDTVGKALTVQLSARDRTRLLEHLVAVALLDEVVVEGERVILDRCAAALELTGLTIDAILAEAQRRLD